MFGIIDGDFTILNRKIIALQNVIGCPSEIQIRNGFDVIVRDGALNRCRQIDFGNVSKICALVSQGAAIALRRSLNAIKGTVMGKISFYRVCRFIDGIGFFMVRISMISSGFDTPIVLDGL